MSPQWQAWANVTHSLGTTGLIDLLGNETPEFAAFRDSRFRESRRMRYYNYPIRETAQQARYPAVFRAMEEVLASSTKTRKNGKDRSCFLVYAFLRLWHLQILNARCDANQRPLFCYEKQTPECVDWLTEALSKPRYHLEENLEWRRG